MFEDVLGLWNKYADTLAQDSRQWSRSGEVEERLRQLDLILGYLEQPLAELRRDSSSWDAWTEVVLFSETFYFVAWRLLEVVTSQGKLAWPGLRRPKALGITFVRNHLIEHPERHGERYARYLTIIDDGPMLKELKTVVDPETKKEVAAPENTDKGLYVNAREFHASLLDCLNEATGQSA